MSRRILSALATIALLVAGGCTSAPVASADSRNGGSGEPASFEAAQLQARRNEGDPATLEWRKQAINRLGGALSVIEPCSAGMALTDIPTVNVVVRLSFQGRTTKAFVAEDSTYARCVRERVMLLDLGSAPRDGYWYDVTLQGPGASAPPGFQSALSFSGEPCVPGTQSGEQGRAALEVTRVTPSSGSTIDQSTRLAISLSYSVPAGKTEPYRLMVLLDSSEPGRSMGTLPVAFPYPLTCGLRGSIVAAIQVGSFWNMPSLSSPMRIRLGLATADGFNLIAVSEAMEFSKR